jgi:hypothetical protein
MHNPNRVCAHGDAAESTARHYQALLGGVSLLALQMMVVGVRVEETRGSTVCVEGGQARSASGAGMNQI